MAASKKTGTTRARKASKKSGAGAGINFGNAGGEDVPMPGTTGRYLVLMREDAVKAGAKLLREDAGLSVASSSDFDDGAVGAQEMSEGEAIIFDDLGVAVVDTPPEQLQSLGIAAADGDSAILAIEPERVCYALEDDPWGESDGGVLPTPPPSPPEPLPSPDVLSAAGVSVEWLRGYREAVNHLIGKLLAASGLPDEAAAEAIAAAVSETELTWGLQATRAAASRFSGRGIRVAVLDTGLDLGHPDFVGRRITSRSFIVGEAVQDGHGHGTHCIGTSCGPKQPGRLPRYGVAVNAEIFAGKVLSNQGSGADGGILAGIQWAITNRCAVVSMSLGSRVMPGEGFSQIYEAVAQRALAAGTLIIAAAGNDSRRPTSILPVSRPANCPSIMAVAALDQRLSVAIFSNAGLNPQGGQVDIAGPGVDVRSSWPRPVLYNTISGTSMATPHVAGIAAQFAEAFPAIRGRALAQLLMQRARRLALPSRDVGAGLVQAP